MPATDQQIVIDIESGQAYEAPLSDEQIATKAEAQEVMRKQAERKLARECALTNLRIKAQSEPWVNDLLTLLDPE